MPRIFTWRSIRSSDKAQPLSGALGMLCLLVLSLLAGGQVLANGVLPAMIEPQVGVDYYTRYAFREEKNKHNTTNYGRGNLVPINTSVKLLSLNSKKMVLEFASGGKVTFVNVAKYTKRGMETIASELLSPEPLNLSGLKPDVRQAIEAGEMILGMTKEEVLMARGYPPRHKTPSTDENTWVYWSSKFITRSLEFEDDRLARGRGLW